MGDQGNTSGLTGLMAKISMLKKNPAQNTASSGDTTADATQPAAPTPQQGLDAFADSLIKEKGFPDITPEVREELKKDLLTRLDDFLTARIVAGLSDEDVMTFDKMLQENKGEEEMQQFVSSHIPNFTDFVTQAMLEFRGVYLGTIPSPATASEDQPKTNGEASMPPPPPPAPVKN